MRIHMMTPVLTTGDAIGNYLLSLKRIFGLLGVNVRLYADYVDPAYRHSARPTSAYRSTGQDILWFHYSIWADNFEVLKRTGDFKVLDYHGVTPPHLLADFDPRLAALCDKGIKALPAHANVFDWCIYHADNGLLDLEPAGYTRFSKVRLPVDTAFFGLQEDPELVAMVQQLGIGITNIVPTASARADELTRDELHAGARALENKVRQLRPTVVAVPLRHSAELPAVRPGAGYVEPSRAAPTGPGTDPASSPPAGAASGTTTSMRVPSPAADTSRR